MIHELAVHTTKKMEFVEITGMVQGLVLESRVQEGICCIYMPHTTAGITINEHADPDVISDIAAWLDKAVPANGRYKHAEGNSAAHIQASLLGSSQTVFIQEGRLLLGSWQGIFFAEFDGPRARRIKVRIY